MLSTLFLSLALAAAPAALEDAPKPCEAAAAMQAAGQKWEYKLLKVKDAEDKALGEMGAQGWEMVSAFWYNQFHFYFKRPAQ